jgi:hypothetical protein
MIMKRVMFFGVWALSLLTQPVCTREPEDQSNGAKLTQGSKQAQFPDLGHILVVPNHLGQVVLHRRILDRG